GGAGRGHAGGRRAAGYMARGNRIGSARNRLMKVLVTGATGFLGSYLTRALIKRGDAVRILARSSERAAQLQAAGVELRVGDLNDPACGRGLADGVETVFHLARSATAASMQEFDRMDVAGTEQLLAEAKRAGVKRFVYVGTLAGYA